MSYTNSKLVEYTKISPNRTLGRVSIKSIAIHCTACDVTVERLGEIFAPASRGASSNYGVCKGRVGMYCEEKDRSWCTSSRYVDSRCVSIEVGTTNSSPFKTSDENFAKLIDLVTDICKRNNIKQLRWSEDKKVRMAGIDNNYIQVHMDYANKSCPGPYLLSLMPKLVKEVNSRLSNKKEEVVVEEKPAKTSYTHKQFIKDVQQATEAKVDGIAGSETLSKTITVSAKTNRKHKVVLPLQKELYRLGYTEVGEADGIAGPKFKEAVEHYQRDKFGKADGIITAKNRTWKSLLGMEV